MLWRLGSVRRSSYMLVLLCMRRSSTAVYHFLGFAEVTLKMKGTENALCTLSTSQAPAAAALPEHTLATASCGGG